jgi:hypothetical protein
VAFVLAAGRVETKTFSVRKTTCCPQELIKPFLHTLVAFK